MNPNNHESPFGEVIYSYTRSQAVADGVQVEVSTVAREAGITFPVFLTRTVFDAYVAVPSGLTGQDESGRLWDILWMMRHAICKCESGRTEIPVLVFVRNDERQPRLVTLKAVCGALDIGDPQPAITVMMPDED